MKDAWVLGGDIACMAAVHELGDQGYVAHVFTAEAASEDGARHGLYTLHGHTLTLREVKRKLLKLPVVWRPELVIVGEALDEFCDFRMGTLVDAYSVGIHQSHIREQVEELGPGVGFVGPQATLRPMAHGVAIVHGRWSVRHLIKGEAVV